MTVTSRVPPLDARGQPVVPEGSAEMSARSSPI